MPSARWLERAACALPTPCAVCRGWSASRLCAACIERHATSRPRCTRCALEVPAGVAVCGTCLREPPRFDRAIAAVDYGYPWDGLIAAFKFHAALDLAPVLAHMLLGAIEPIDGPRPDVVLPVPLGRARLAERGYNQAWELARRVARTLGARADARLLRRIKETPQQLGLSRAERAANVRGAFLVEPRRAHELRGRDVALVDDVLTTGATADEIALVLRQAGAAQVRVWALARTPKE